MSKPVDVKFASLNVRELTDGSYLLSIYYSGKDENGDPAHVDDDEFSFTKTSKLLAFLKKEIFAADVTDTVVAE